MYTVYGDVELSIYDRSIQVCLCNDPVSFPHPTRFDPARFGRGEFGERRANPNPNPNPAATPTPTPNPNPNPKRQAGSNLVKFNDLITKMVDKLKEEACAASFILPVGNSIRDYKRFVKKAMCLVDIRQKSLRQTYKARALS